MSDSIATPWTVAHQAPLSTGFPRQEKWSRLPFPSPGDLPEPGIEPVSPAVAGRFFTPESPRMPFNYVPLQLKKGFPRGSLSTGAHWHPLCGLLIRKTYLPTDPAEKWWKGSLYFLGPLIHQSIGLAKKFTWVSITFYGKT